jgi:serine/threonine-protein kinase RsbW
VVEAFRAHPSQLTEIRARIRELATQSGLSEDRIDDLVLAVSEACANAIVHSGSDQIGLVWRELDGRIEIQVEDAGIFRRRVPMPEVDGVGGHGIPLMMALVDEIAIREGTARRPGTRVRLVVNQRSAASTGSGAPFPT